jgi:hypothetical protein
VRQDYPRGTRVCVCRCLRPLVKAGTGRATFVRMDFIVRRDDDALELKRISSCNLETRWVK